MTTGTGMGMGFVGHPWGYILFNIMYIFYKSINLIIIIAEEGDPLFWCRNGCERGRRGDPLLLGLLKRRERGGIPHLLVSKVETDANKGQRGDPPPAGIGNGHE